VPMPDGDSACADLPALSESHRLQRWSRNRYRFARSRVGLVVLTWEGRRWRTQP
jgi:hypothetical protein